jgi:hypothetical protein
LLPVPVALLAFALYVVDEALGLPFGWISNRNAVLSTAFSCIALMAYLRYRDAGRGEPDAARAPPPARRDLVLAVVSYSVALTAGEYAVCMFGYFLAYELLVAREPRAVRARALTAIAAPALVYIAVRAALGLSPKHSGVYLDPFTQPISFLTASLQRFPAIYADLVLAVRADWWTFGSPWVAKLYDAGLVGQDWFWTLYPWRSVHVALGVVAMVLMAVIFRVAPRDEDARNTRWLLAGGTLSIAAVMGSFPSSRLLLIAMLGFAPIFASLGWSQLTRVRERWQRARVRTALAIVATGSFLLYHLIVPAISTYDETEATVNVAHAVRRSVLNMRVDQERLRKQHLVVLLTLEGGASLYVPLTRALNGMSTPRTCWTLSLTPADHVLTRDSERSFVFSPVGGFTLLAGAPEAMLRSFDDAFKPGDTVDVGGMRVKVLALLRGAPKSIRVTFAQSLEDPSLLFVTPTKNGIVPFAMPAIGQSVIVPIQSLL